MKIEKLILEGWECYSNKVASGLLIPSNEKMMQLQLAQIYQALGPIYEYDSSESIKVLLEVPATIGGSVFRSIDMVISHSLGTTTTGYPIELKCFRRMTRNGTGTRGAQNLGMYDYWEDIENIEGYARLPGYPRAFQFTLTDDLYYVTTAHKGSQVAVYSTNQARVGVTGLLSHPIANRQGKINLTDSYSMDGWKTAGVFRFISQQTPPTPTVTPPPAIATPQTNSKP